MLSIILTSSRPHIHRDSSLSFADLPVDRQTFHGRLRFARIEIRLRDLLWNILRLPYYVIMSQFKSTEKRIFTTHKHFTFAQQISEKQSLSVWWKSGFYMMESIATTAKYTPRVFGWSERPQKAESEKQCFMQKKGLTWVCIYIPASGMKASAAWERRR